MAAKKGATVSINAEHTQPGARYQRAGAQSAVMHYFTRHSKQAVDVLNAFSAVIFRDGEGALTADEFTLWKRATFLWPDVTLMERVDMSTNPSTTVPLIRKRVIAVPNNAQFERVA